jgi:zinc transporter 7
MSAAGPPSSAVAAAFISTAIISCAPNVLLFLFPNYGSNSNSSGRTILSMGQALAVGGLLGDVFLHTLPDCFMDSIDNGKNGGFEIIGLRIILGFSFFLILDIFVRSLEGGGHSHKSNNIKTNITKKNNDDKRSPWKCLLSSTVLLNLLGDSLHNFTDGMAIGATYCITEMPTAQQADESTFVSWTSSAFTFIKSKGGLASISVFLHEVPHELGDFATLVTNGLSRNQAIGCQFLTAIAAFAGTAFGLFSGQIIEGLDNDVLLPFTAGGTVHIFGTISFAFCVRSFSSLLPTFL